MYLVLTALLALNVSKEILNAFVTVNDSLITTNMNFYDKNQSAYNDFEASYNENKVKTEKWYNKAQEVKKESSDFVQFLTDVKAKLISKTEVKPMNEVVGKGPNGVDTVLSLTYVEKKDNKDVPTNILGMSAPKKPKEQSDKLDVVNLKQRMESYRENMLAVLPEEVKQGDLGKSIRTTFAMEPGKEHGQPVSWEQNSFYDTPLAAVITILSKIQTDVRNVESDMVKYLYSQVDASSFKFNKLEAAVISETNYVLKGDSFKAQVFLAAFDTTQDPRISFGEKYLNEETFNVSGDTLEVDVKHGKGYLKVPASREGDFNWKGVIRLKNPEGVMVNYPTEVKYKVARPNLTVSADKMNVFYKGVDNPVSISVPGVATDDITPRIDNGKIKKKGRGQWIVQVKKGIKAKITVYAEINGERTKMGTSEFRVKSVPDPVPYFAGVGPKDDAVKKKFLTAAQGVIARMENFDFDLKFNVTSFKMTVIVGGKPIEQRATGPRVTSEMKQILAKVKPGQKIYLEDIRAKGPDGRTRKLGSLALKVL